MFLLKSLGFLILKQKYPFAHHLNLLLPREKIWCLSTLWFFFLMSEFVYGVHVPNFKSHVHLNKKLPYDPSGWMSNHFSMCGKMALVHKYLCVCVCVCVYVCIKSACSDEQYRNCMEKTHGRDVCVVVEAEMKSRQRLNVCGRVCITKLKTDHSFTALVVWELSSHCLKHTLIDKAYANTTSCSLT